MSSLTLSGGPPTFTEVPDDDLDSGLIITAAIMQAINEAVCWAAVSCEDFWGYYQNGETVVTPTSPADGYAYSRQELLYTWEIWDTRPSTGALNGTQTTPTVGPQSGAGSILEMGFNVDQQSGDVACRVDYYQQGGSQSTTTDGVLLVHVLARRLSGLQTYYGYIVGTQVATSVTQI
ncbi:MAG: hypothetical protein KGL39_11570 [Patescibacteria group bacterium]|nr:hypothetical protein [Patescibacteria group bacterium]